MGIRFRQWTLMVENDEYEIVNLDSNRKQQYYKVVSGEYGQPIIVAEPDLAFAVPTELRYVNKYGGTVAPTEKIAGIICKDGPRFSLTNAKNKGVVIKANDDGSIQVGDEVWWISTLFSKDKNRIVGYDAFLIRERPNVVMVRELGDLDLF